MWYKNARIYPLTKNIEFDENNFHEILAKNSFKPCSKYQPDAMGWISPLADQATVEDNSDWALFEKNHHCVCLKLKIQEKILPPSVIRESVLDKVHQKEIKEGRKIFLKEQRQIRDEVVEEMMPQAFHRSSYIQGYWDLEKNWLVIDAASATKAEKFIHLLRLSLGSLPVKPLDFLDSPTVRMTSVLHSGNSGKDWIFADECELRSTDEESTLVRFKHQDLYADEIKPHIDNGRQVISLRLIWNDAITATILEHGTLKRIHFADKVKELDSSYSKDEVVAKKAHELNVMVLEMRQFLIQYIDFMGGSSE